MPAYIETFSGKRFYPLTPTNSEVCIEDIAHALSRQCRFAGHVREFYSVAEHSLHVCEWLWRLGYDYRTQAWGLLHDASEAYLVDLPTPLKTGEFGAAYRKAEDSLMAVIMQTFGLQLDMPAAVREADAVLLSTEARQFMRFDERNWQGLVDPIPGGVRRLGDADVVESKFNRKFYELKSKL